MNSAERNVDPDESAECKKTKESKTNVDPDESAEYKKAKDAACAACEVDEAYKKWKEAIKARQGILPLLNVVKWHMENAATYEPEAWDGPTKAMLNGVIKAMEAAIKDMESTGTTDSMERTRDRIWALKKVACEAQESSLAEYNTLRTNMGLHRTFIIPRQAHKYVQLYTSADHNTYSTKIEEGSDSKRLKRRRTEN